MALRTSAHKHEYFRNNASFPDRHHWRKPGYHWNSHVRLVQLVQRRRRVEAVVRIRFEKAWVSGTVANEPKVIVEGHRDVMTMVARYLVDFQKHSTVGRRGTAHGTVHTRLPSPLSNPSLARSGLAASKAASVLGYFYS